MKQLNLLLLLLIPLLNQAQDIFMTLNGNPGNPKFQAASISYAMPTTGDTSQALTYVTGNTNSLLRFDLASLPPNAIITSAYLYLYGVTTTEKSWKAAPINSVFDGSNAHYDQMVFVEKVLQPWSLSTVSWNTQPAHADDYDPSTKFLPVPAGTWANYKVDLTDFVTGWVSTPSTNYGLTLALNYLNSKEANSMNFYSGQAAAELQPRLVVNYQVPAPGPICMGSLTLHGNLADGKYKQINYRSAPGVNDSAGAQIEASYVYNW